MAKENEFVLTVDNYYSQQANEEYMSVSQYKDFAKCQVYAMAKLKGEYVEKKSPALLQGGYMDSYFSHRLDKFKEENPQIFKKDGTLLKDYEKVNECIETALNDKFFMEEIKGDTQVLLVGKIAGVKFKGLADFLNSKIVDMKLIASIMEKVWVEDKETGRKKLTDFIEAYEYDKQGAVYVELAKQMFGVELPFELACISKEDSPDKAIINIEQEYLDRALKEMKENIPTYDKIKRGLLEPIGCGNCPVCRAKKKLTQVISYKQMRGVVEDEN